jgi:multiple antibiotic resistance protein
MIALFLKAFIALFVSIDAVGALPVLTSLTRNMGPYERKRIVNKATLAALIMGVVFIFGGQFIFRFLGITENDFRVAGGVLLLVFAIKDLSTSSHHQGSENPTSVGIVPIAIPIMMGPAALTTLMIGAKEYGFFLTVISLIANLLLAWLLFSRASWFIQKIGVEASDAIAKVFSLFLAAIAVMLIRMGIKGML